MSKLIQSLTLSVVVCCGVTSAAFAEESSELQGAELTSAQQAADAPAADSQPEPETLGSDEADDSEDLPQDIDERFETEGYVGGYIALLQQTVPTVGFTGSLFLDDDLRLGIDISLGNSEKIFGSFKTRGAALWGAWEISDTTWTKVGLSYSKLERKSAQEPLSVLTKGEDKSDKNLELRNDSLGLDFGVGQLWSGASYSIAVDYVGFTVPVLRLTGEKLPMYSLQLARVAALYNIE